MFKRSLSLFFGFMLVSGSIASSAHHAMPWVVFCDNQDNARHIFSSNTNSYHNNYINPLRYYSAQQLAYYFDNAHFSEDEILSQRELYCSDEFIKIAKTCSGYERTLQELKVELARLSIIKKIAYSFTGNYLPGFKKRIDYLYNELQKEKLLHAKPELTKINLLPTSCINEYKELEKVYQIYSSFLSKALEKRLAHQTNQKNNNS